MSEARIALLVVVLLGLAEVGCRRAPLPSKGGTPSRDGGAQLAFPVRVRDDTGRVVDVAAEPKRILCLLPSFTETVFALGLGDRVVAVDDYSDYPPQVQQLPKLGGMYDTQVERALSLEPDLILISEGSSAVRSLARSGAAVWAGSARKFDDVYRVIETTGQLVGRPREAAALVAQMRAEIATTEASVRALPLVSIYYELDPTPYSVGPASFIGVLIAKAGGKNIVPSTLGDFPKINPELVVASDPQVIIGASLEEVAHRPGWGRLSAVKSRRVFTWSTDEAHLVSRPGPRLPQGLSALVRRLHPEP